ncbi:MAG: patatin-like phospholipase family protein [Deltaproteobacteria bacterium]|nr:patatin-like phospholipase family protein [Deltaproteobacteria bacterium]
MSRASPETLLLAARRRPLDQLESRLVRRHLAAPDASGRAVLDALRYVISLARLTSLRGREGRTLAVGSAMALHSAWVKEEVEKRLVGLHRLSDLSGTIGDLVQRTREVRGSLLANLPVDRQELEAQVCRRTLVVVSGGGGGAGFVYPGVYHRLERMGLTPDLMVGTSIGALLSLFRARHRTYDQAVLMEGARSLSWSGIFTVLESKNRYGLPATLKMDLQGVLGPIFRHPEGRTLYLSELEIPTYVVSTGITVDALKHDMDYYEHFFDGEVQRGAQAGLRSVAKTMQVVREFLSRPDALVEVVLGRDAGTERFDALDAAGFSSAIPGALHYDVLRSDARMHRILDALYAERGITRLGEGGMVANVASRVGWESAAAGRLGIRNSFVLSLDCFAPSLRSPLWIPLAEAVRRANVVEHSRFADLTLTLTRTLSPLNLVPSVRDSMTAMRWGREALEPHVPFMKEMMRPIPRLGG